MTTKRGFERTAGAISLAVNGNASAVAVGTPRRFSTGSMGWNVTGKVVVVTPDGTMHRCQLTGNVVIVGSKEWADDDEKVVAQPPAKPPVQVTEPLDPSKMTPEQRRQLKAALLAADRESKKAEYAFEVGDVLQVSRNKGKWEDFVTLKNEAEGAMAKQRVADPKTANLDGIVEFRITRKGKVVHGK